MGPTTACMDQNCMERRVVVDHDKIELYCVYKNYVGLLQIVDNCRFPPPTYYIPIGGLIKRISKVIFKERANYLNGSTIREDSLDSDSKARKQISRKSRMSPIGNREW